MRSPLLSLSRAQLFAGMDLTTDHPSLAIDPWITWPIHYAPRASIFFVDMGPDRNESTSRSFFPFVHSLWTECYAGQKRLCHEVVKPYQPPGNYEREANRYTFIAFAHEGPLKINGKSIEYRKAKVEGLKGYELWKKVKPVYSNFSFARLLEENDGMKAVAYNWVKCHM